MVSRSFFVVNSCYHMVSQIVFQRSSYSGIPAFPTAVAQQNSGVLLEYRSFPLVTQWLDSTSCLLNSKMWLSFKMQEGSNLDTVGNCTIFFFPSKTTGTNCLYKYWHAVPGSATQNAAGQLAVLYCSQRHSWTLSKENLFLPSNTEKASCCTGHSSHLSCFL